MKSDRNIFLGKGSRVEFYIFCFTLINSMSHDLCGRFKS